MLPRARTKDLVVEELPDEALTLVCDLEQNTNYSLPSLTALVWSRCDGATSVDGLVAMARHRGVEADEGLVSAALDELVRVGLVSDWKQRGMSRRALLRNAAGAVGIATILAPEISEGR